MTATDEPSLDDELLPVATADSIEMTLSNGPKKEWTAESAADATPPPPPELELVEVPPVGVAVDDAAHRNADDVGVDDPEEPPYEICVPAPPPDTDVPAIDEAIFNRVATLLPPSAAIKRPTIRDDGIPYIPAIDTSCWLANCLIPVSLRAGAT